MVSRAFSALCMYSTFGHHHHPPGYLCAKFCFFRGPECWASRWRKIVYSINHLPSSYSITHSLAQLIWCPGNQSLCFGKSLEKNISVTNSKCKESTSMLITAAISVTNLLVKNSVERSVLVDMKCLLVAQLFNVDRLSWIEAESLSQLLHFIVEKIDLLLTAVDALYMSLDFPDKCTQQISTSHTVVITNKQQYTYRYRT